jgi:PAS domain S-box-containing protein
MSLLRNIRIASKLYLAFAVLLGLMVTLGLLAVNRFSLLAAESTEISGNILPKLDHLANMDAMRYALRVMHLKETIARTPKEISDARSEMKDRLVDFNKQRDAYDALSKNAEERALWDRFNQQWNTYLKYVDQMHGMVDDGKGADALTMLGKVGGEARATFLGAGDTLHKAIGITEKSGNAAAAAAGGVYERARSQIIMLITAAAIFGGLTALLVSGAITKPLAQALTVFRNISDGHLDNEFEHDGRDEVGLLLSGLDDMQSKMRVKLQDERRIAAENHSQVEAMNRAKGVMEFEPNGTVIAANANALQALGYTLEEVRGRHHSMFIDPAQADSEEYRSIWAKLARGESDMGDYRCVGKNGRIVWLQAIYNPIVDSSGKVQKIVEYSSDETARVALRDQMQLAVEETRQVAKAAADGDLNKRLDASRLSGELRAMADGVNSLIENMAGMVRQIKTASAEVARGTAEISAGNINLSQRTEQQSSSLEETASSMEEMTATVKNNADNAAQANQLALAARAEAEKGGAVVGDAVRAMHEINESSRRIADIIGVIDEIAFQTNLLALNAAVEAARAGEQGRGFAVVASEVRALAGRSATAAKEIKELIQDSVSKVQGGSELVTRSGETLSQIQAAAAKVSNIVAEIAAGSREQAQGIEQVNKAIMQMESTTQQNAALVEQASAASDAMAGQARELSEIMARYQIAGDDSMSAPAVATITKLPPRTRTATAKASAPPRQVPRDNAASAPTLAATGTDGEWTEF